MLLVRSSVSIAVLALLLVSQAGSAEVIAHWKMDEPVGTSVADETGVHGGTAVATSIVPGQPLQSLGSEANLARLLTGDPSHISVADHPDWDLGSEFTLEIWAFPISFGGALISHFSPTGNNRSIVFDLNGSDGLRLIVTSDGSSNGVDGNAETALEAVELGEWQSVADRGESQ